MKLIIPNHKPHRCALCGWADYWGGAKCPQCGRNDKYSRIVVAVAASLLTLAALVLLAALWAG